MKEYQANFIDFCVENGVLTFGAFTLKSGRTSPYFFNAGKFNDGRALARLGEFYSDAIVDHLQSTGRKYDIIFGPAYKGIPLASVTCSVLFSKHHLNFSYAFNRKEAKDHGEGGVFVGSNINGNVLIVDDVITAGTAVREVIGMLEKVGGAQIGGLVVALDRQEVGPGGRSAIAQLEEEYNIPVVSIVTLDEVVTHLESSSGYEKEILAIRDYKKEYGV